MITTYKQSIDVGWYDSQRTLQLVYSCEYFILSFEDSFRIGFYLQAIRVVIANMNIEIVYQTKLLFEQIYRCSFLTDFFNIDKASFQQLQKLFATLL